MKLMWLGYLVYSVANCVMKLCIEGLFRCSQTAKTFGEMSTFWKNGSKQGLVNLAVKIWNLGP